MGKLQLGMYFLWYLVQLDRDQHELQETYIVIAHYNETIPQRGTKNS